MQGTLLENSVVQRISDDTAVGTTTISSSGVDCAGFDGALFIVSLGTITDGTPEITVQQSDDDGATDAYSDLEGTLVQGADDDDDDNLVVDIRRPLKRWLRVQCIRGGATGCVIDAMTAIKYGAQEAPTTQVVANSESHVSPEEGTA